MARKAIRSGVVLPPSLGVFALSYFMRFPSILLSVGLFATGAFGQVDSLATAPNSPQDFEPASTFPVEHFVPAALLTGRLHTVRPLGENDGLMNIYFLETPGEVLAITGTTALTTRIREVYALDYLQGLSKTEEFAKAIGQAGKAKVASIAGIARDPLGTIKNVPKGASRFFGRVGESVKGQGSGDDAGALAGLTGVTKAKAKLAATLGVNPYTTNEALQKELNAVARATAGGGLIVNAATAAVSGPAGSVISIVGVNQALQDTLINSTPEDLRASNRKQLYALGVDHALADDFLLHPWINPWHETIITHALTRIGIDPSGFLTGANQALTTEDADYFQRIAQILARYHTTTAPLRSIRIERGLITALDRDGTVVIPVSLDYATWTERVSRRLDGLAPAGAGSQASAKLTFWTDGQLSNRLCAEFKARGIAYRSQALSDQ
jgi:hypothetical protein